jgi:hypothetical protein
MTDDKTPDNVKKLNVRFKEPPKPEEPMLREVSFGGCNHQWFFTENGDGSLSGTMHQVQYLIRQGETEVECGHCHARLDPMFVLKLLAREENKWNEARKRYLDEMKRLDAKSRTKCQHCERMTRIR